MRLCRLFTIIAKLKVSKYRIPGFSLQFAEFLLFQLMDSPQHVVDDEMGNKVSGTGAAAASSKEEEKTKEAVESPEADPDFAEELAELERAGSALLVLDDTELEAELPETPRSTSSICIDGNPSQEAMTLRFDSDDTESRSVGSVRSRKSSVTSVKRAEEENMDQVSSEDENEFCSDNETKKKKKKKDATSNRLSTESITSNDELRREEVVDGTPCQDEKEKVAEEGESLIDPEKVQRVTRNLSMGCEPISDTERDSDGGCETSRKVKLSTPLGMKIHIRSIEEELDDIESDEENYSEQEQVAVKKAQEEEDKEMEVVGDGEGGKDEEKEEQETIEVEKLSEKEEEHEKEEEPGEYPWGFN